MIVNYSCEQSPYAAVTTIPPPLPDLCSIPLAVQFIILLTFSSEAEHQSEGYRDFTKPPFH